MDIPFHMRYRDPLDTPPLFVDIEPGYQVLDGKKSVEFLRFRRGSPGYRGYPDGDLGRIKAQQEFVKSAAKKSLSLDLPKIVQLAFENIQSDISIKAALYLGSKAIGIESENIRTYQIPVKGADIHPDKQGIADMLTEIYSMEAVIIEEETDEGMGKESEL
jgi:anionic cell wall polymer biosynthesis LytR-Cps2A-Psr (LCP) family protein